MIIAETLAKHARSRPMHPAIVDRGRTITYGELFPLVMGTTARLNAAGIGLGTAVAVMLGESADHLVILHALARLGAVIVPIHPSTAAMERDDSIRLCGCRFVVADDGAAALGDVGMIRIDAGWRDAPTAAAACPPPPLSEDVTALLVLSSGTTGRPKAMALTQRQLRERFDTYRTGYGVNAEDRYLTVLSLSFNVGRNMPMGLLHHGGTVVVGEPTSMVSEFLAAMRRHAITWTYVTPSHLRGLLAWPRQAGPLLPGMRQLLVGSSEIRPEERKAARERVTPNLYESYGTTECGLMTVGSPADHGRYPDAVGRPIPGATVEIVDERHRSVPAGEVGLLRARAPGSIAGYWRDPATSARAFFDGWFYPGDLAAMNAEGYVFLKGRADDVINRAGVKFYPAEVEAALRGHPQVEEAAVIGWRTAQADDVPFAFVAARSSLKPGELVDFAVERLTAVKRPRHIVVLPDLPRNAMGKVDRARLRAMVAEIVAQSAATSAALD